MAKMERRKIECAANGNVDLQRSEPKLSIETDSKIPCFVKGLEVKNSKKYGNHIMTNRDLEIGQTVIVERALCYIDTESHTCANCYKRKANLFPCKTCTHTNSIFCSESCHTTANEKFHNVFCKIELLFKLVNQNLLLKSIIVAIKTFSTVEALMIAVENILAQNGTEIDFGDPAKRAYFQFFKLHTNMDAKLAVEKNDLKQKTMEVVEAICCLSSIKEMFQSTKMKQFLSHLALHHMHIIESNVSNNASHGISYPYADVLGIEKRAKK